MSAGDSGTDTHAFHNSVLAECETAVPAGAYADTDFAYYVFLNSRGAYAFSQALHSGRPLRALSATIPLFSWDEREMAQDWAVRFDDLPDDRPLHANEGEMPAARFAQGVGIMQFVVGPVHAGIIEGGRFTFSSGGETIVYLDAQLGYAHRGVEGALKDASPVQAAAKIARICGGCSAARSLAYAMAIEKLAAFEPEPEIELVRLIVAELERVYNHLADLAAGASGAGYAAGFARGMALKERAMRLCHAVSGHRLLFDAIAPGGLGRPLLEDRAAFGMELSALERDVRLYVDALFGNASVISRWAGAGIVPHATAQAFGAVGPAFRASGGSIDIRSFTPYAAYRWLPVSVACREAGDVRARCEVKRDETIESLGLIRRALHELRYTSLPPQEPLEARPGIGLSVVEGPRGTELVAVHVGANKCIERIHFISASYRNWPIAVRAMENNIVPDFPLVNKSFNLCYACADR